MSTMIAPPEYSPPREVFNVWSHGIVGVTLWSVTLVLATVLGWRALPGALLLLCQPAGMLIVCAASGWFHSSPTDARQRVDRLAISFGIALSATSHIVGLRIPAPDGLLTAVWVLAFVAAAFEVVRNRELEWVGTALLAGNALTAVFGTDPTRIGCYPERFIWFGIAAYAFGFAFFLYETIQRRNIPWAHGVWHVFVLIGGALHCTPLLLAISHASCGS